MLCTTSKTLANVVEFAVFQLGKDCQITQGEILLPASLDADYLLVYFLVNALDSDCTSDSSCIYPGAINHTFCLQN
jgi:hypothetical protein